MKLIAAACLTGVLFALPARADVVDAAANGFSIRVAAEVNAVPAAVFRAIGQVAARWESDHTWSGSAANLSIDLRAGGCFCETLPGGAVQHMTVTYVDAPKVLRLQGGLGPLAQQAVTGSMTWTLTDKPGGTAVVLTYNVGGYMPGGLNTIASAVNGVLALQIQRLKSFIETGRPR